MRSSIVVSALLLVGCATTSGTSPKSSGSGVRTPTGAKLEDPRPLITAGARCQGASCTCRAVDATGATVGEPVPDPNDPSTSREGAVPEGMKRFELRTGRGPDDVEITVEDRGTLHKTGEGLDAACGYIDLPPGEHRVRVRVKAGAGQGGASPKVLIYEHGQRTHSWYHTFGLTCGETGPCTHGDLEERIARLARARGLFDPCGSVKVGGIRWDADKAADERITSLDLELVLKVYKFPSRFPHGGVCKGPSPE